MDLRYSKMCRSMPRRASASASVSISLSHWPHFSNGSHTVGRTGSGKSTLTLAILRCIYTEGTVLYDGLPVNTINLDALRSNITIIPQVVSAPHCSC